MVERRRRRKDPPPRRAYMSSASTRKNPHRSFKPIKPPCQVDGKLGAYVALAKARGAGKRPDAALQVGRPQACWQRPQAAPPPPARHMRLHVCWPLVPRAVTRYPPKHTPGEARQPCLGPFCPARRVPGRSLAAARPPPRHTHGKRRKSPSCPLAAPFSLQDARLAELLRDFHASAPDRLAAAHARQRNLVVVDTLCGQLEQVR